VGFIQKLPTQLVAAFRATLEELADAAVLVHVVDITHPDAALQSATVEATLRDLELGDKPRVTALNKVDLLRDEDGAAPRSIDDLREHETAFVGERTDAVLVSAEKGWGLDALRRRVVQVLDRTAGVSRRAAGE
jgi:GTP-binding protein HflX